MSCHVMCRVSCVWVPPGSSRNVVPTRRPPPPHTHTERGKEWHRPQKAVLVRKRDGEKWAARGVVWQPNAHAWSVQHRRRYAAGSFMVLPRDRPATAYGKAPQKDKQPSKYCNCARAGGGFACFACSASQTRSSYLSLWAGDVDDTPGTRAAWAATQQCTEALLLL